MAVVLIAAPAAQRTGPSSPGASFAQRRSSTDGLVQAAETGAPYLSNQVLVKFRAGTSAARQQRALSVLRGRPSIAALRRIGEIAVVHDPMETDAAAMAARLNAQPDVEFAQPNYIRRLPGVPSGETWPLSVDAAPTRLPSDPDYDRLQWNMPLVGMPAAWAINPGGRDTITVAVIDTGFTSVARTLTAPLWTGSRFDTVTLPFAAHPDFSAARITDPRDFTGLPGAGGQVLDLEGHGTHVASTIAEESNNVGLIGLAYNVKVMPLKVCFGYWDIMLDRASRGVQGFVPAAAGGCPDDLVTEAIRYAADHGARVINLSLGGPQPSPAQLDALGYAVGRGVFVAVSAGNDHDRGNPVEYPAAYGPQIAGVMTVGAIGKSRTRSYYSSTRNVEVVAPGGNDRDGSTPDFGYVWQTTLFPPDQDPFVSPVPRFDRFRAVGYEGTSMASPHVAGLAALLMSQGDVRDPRAVEAFIRGTALDLGAPGRDDEFGHGLIQARGALFGSGIRR